jgi:hypothetical protein
VEGDAAAADHHDVQVPHAYGEHDGANPREDRGNQIVRQARDREDDDQHQRQELGQRAIRPLLVLSYAVPANHFFPSLFRSVFFGSAPSALNRRRVTTPFYRRTFPTPAETEG